MVSNKTWPVYTLVFAAIILSIITAVLVVNSTGNGATKDDIKLLSDKINALNVNPVVSVVVPENNKTNAIYDKVTEDDQKEDEALRLVLEEMDSRDFKKFLMSFLNKNKASIEDYKDIESISVTDSDVVVVKDSATVTLDIKIKFFNDGDTDSEDIETAKISGEFSVSDLDFDDKFIDAEVESYDASDFDFIKFYSK